MIRVVFISILPFCLVLNCSQPVSQNQLPDDEPLVFYEIFLRSFYDSNGDGIGDINGLVSKLDYIESLGANAIWLLPVHPAPSYHKYDVTDYYGIDPVYGTIEDFKHLVEALHKRGIKIVMDMVFNHSSEEHAWFQEAMKGPENPFRDYYVWNHPDSINENQHNWHLRPAEDRKNDHSGEKYFGFFWKGMPDLNFDNREVREEIKKIGAYWLNDIGVDGFRLDAALHIYPFYPDRVYEQSVEWWEEFHEAMEGVRKTEADDDNVFLIGEVWEGDTITSYFLEKGLDATFNFELAARISETLKAERDSFYLVDELIKTRAVYQSKNPGFQDAIFLSNHDQNRIMSELGGDPEKAKLAASILLTLPGIPFIYYGEELGMLGQKPDEQIREPMPWDEPGTDRGQTTWEPFEYNRETKNVKTQTEDSGSILSHYKEQIAYRKGSPALHSGEIHRLPFMMDDKRILAFERQADGHVAWVFHNLTRDTVQIQIPETGESDNSTLSPFGRLILEKKR